MKKSLFGMYLAALVAVAVPTFAQQQTQQPPAPADRTAADALAIDPDTAVRLALQNNLGLEAERIALRRVKRSNDYAWNSLVPSIGASATLARPNKAPASFPILTPVTPGPLNPDILLIDPGAPPRWDLGTSLNFSLTVAPSLLYGIRYTGLAYDAQRITLEQAKKRLARDVRKSFYNLLLAQENIDLLENSLETARRRFEQSRINYQNGLVSELTLLNAQVTWENLKPSLRDAVIGYQIALMSFKQTLGIDDDEEVVLEGSIDQEPVELDGDRLIAGNLANRLDLASIRKNIEILKNTRKSYISGTGPGTGFLPALTFSFSLSPAFQGDPFGDSWFDGDRWEDERGAFAVTLSLALDSFLPGSKTRVNIANTEDQIEEARLGLEQAYEGALLEVRRILMQLGKSLESIDALQLNVQLAQRAFQLSEEAYETGNRELLEVEDAQDALERARIELLREKYNYITGLLDLEYGLNTNLFGQRTEK